MPDEPNEPTQRTEKGLEIPIPTREDFMRTLQKVIPPKSTFGDAADEAPSADTDTDS